MESFRRGVMAVLINDKGEVLMGERSDQDGAWQFPQGGIDGEETPKEAFFREVEEELGTSEVEILKVADRTTRYRWPEPGKNRVGQEHTWFLARLKKGAQPRLEKSDGCFQSWKWETPESAVAQIIDWKRPATKEGLHSLGLLKETK